VVFGGIVMLVAAVSVLVVKDVGAGKINTLIPPEDAIAGVAE
jgi:hypothetical protein